MFFYLFKGLPLEVFQNLIAGHLTVETDHTTQMIFQINRRLEQAEGKSLSDAYIWYDYFSIPQIVERSEDQDVSQELQNAVDSFPAYVAMSDYFFVVAPPTTHWRGHTCTLNTYLKRGWCRVEQFAHVLLHDEIQPQVVIRSPQQVLFVAGNKWVHNYPVEGEFAVESDRIKVKSITAAMLDGKISQSWKAQKVKPTERRGFLVRAFQSLRNTFLREPPPDRDRILSPTDVEQFLQRYSFSSATEEVSAYGVGPLYFALVEGDLSMADALLKQGADVNAKIKKDIPDMFVASGMSMFTSVLFLTQSVSAAQWCVDNGADINEIHPFMKTGVVQCCFTTETLKWCVGHPKFNYSVMIDKPNFLRQGVLSQAVIQGNCGVVKDLIEQHGRDVNERDYWGMTPLFHCSSHDDTNISQLLLDNGADPTVTLESTRFTIAWTLEKVGEIGVMAMKEPTIFFRAFGSYRGSSVLHLLVVMGCLAIAKQLIDHLKKIGKLAEVLAIKNYQGRTAIDMARDERHEAMLKLYSDAEAELSMGAGAAKEEQMVGA
eukprot:gnl/TRDRNA2_/TRDRNA2_138844_c0_seq2.p1 gnl/TRDRNA2_/TRDRNA2_138844_c0~~gnl/TRDRNA2_/TRDRNA2_138844_c0_seq2.p1  ORF type:complete len:545 (-),score=90.58 gnl/TRDRNA2_/TRDRNA2_138844_c0_seq2:42-1676(-)